MVSRMDILFFICNQWIIMNIKKQQKTENSPASRVFYQVPITFTIFFRFLKDFYIKISSGRIVLGAICFCRVLLQELYVCINEEKVKMKY